MNGEAVAIDRAVASRQSDGSACTLPCRGGGEFRVQLVVTSKGAFGHPCEASTRKTAAPRRTPSRRAAHLSAPALGYETKGTISRRGPSARGNARRMIDGMRQRGLARRHCGKTGTRVRGYRRSMTVELSCDSFVDFVTWFSHTQWEKVASRRRGFVQERAKRFCGDRGERRAYILNRE